MFQTTSHQPVFLSASVGEDQETLSTLKWPDGPPLLQCFKIGFWLPLYLLQKEHERTIKSPAGSNTCQKLHITFHRNIAFPCRILRHWQQILPQKAGIRAVTKAWESFQTKAQTKEKKNGNRNKPSFCIRSSSFFRCSSSLASQICWDVSSDAESVKGKPNTERRWRNSACSEICWLQCVKECSKKWSETSSRALTPDTWIWSVWEGLVLPSKRTGDSNGSTMHNLQSCSRDTGVCLQISGMFSALKAIKILHSWRGHAQVANPKMCFLMLSVSHNCLRVLPRVIHSSSSPNVRFASKALECCSSFSWQHCVGI